MNIYFNNCIFFSFEKIYPIHVAILKFAFVWKFAPNNAANEDNSSNMFVYVFLWNIIYQEIENIKMKLVNKCIPLLLINVPVAMP